MHVASLVLDRKVGRAALVPCQRFDLPTGEKQGNPEAAVEAASSGEAKKRKKQKLPHLRKIPMNWLLQAIYSTMFCPTSHLFSIIWEAIPVQFFSSNTTVGYGSYDFITSTQRDTFLFSLTVFPPCYSCCCYVILSWLLVPDDIFLPRLTASLSSTREAIRSRLCIAHQEHEFVQYVWQQYMECPGAQGEAAAGDAEGEQMHRASWWVGQGSKALEGHVPSQQTAEQFNCMAKRDIKRVAEQEAECGLETHSKIVLSIERCIALWSAPVQPIEHNSEGLHSLMGAPGYISVAKPHRPGPIMLEGTGFKVKPPGKKEKWMATIPTLVRLMQKKRSRYFQEIRRGERSFIVMSVYRPQNLPPDLGQRIIKLLQTRSHESLREQLMMEGILKREQEPEQHLHFMLKKYNDMFDTYCVISRHPKVCCSCWHFARKGCCPHAFACEEFWQIRKHTETPLPHGGEIQEPGISEDVEAAALAPARRRR